MFMYFSSQIRNYSLAAVFGCATLLSLGAASAQKPLPAAWASQQAIKSTKMIQVDAPVLVNPQPNFVMALPNGSPHAIQFRPVMGQAAYDAAKAKANKLNVPGATRPSPLNPAAPVLQTLTIKGINFNGEHQEASRGFIFEPPDTTGAIGTTHYVEVTNTNISIFDRSVHPTPTSLKVVKSMSLNNFFGYTNKTSQFLFDPRVIYDPVAQRWIVTAVGFPESTTVQKLFIGVSRTNDPTGAFFIYKINVDFFANNDFWDFPQLGENNDALLFTANIFDTFGNFDGADYFGVPKSALYNGQAFVMPLFTGLAGTLTPPIVFGDPISTHIVFLIAANAPDTKFPIYLVASPESPSPLVLSASVPVTPFALPPAATQPGSTTVLDTSDGRFVNNSTQNDISSISISGSDLWVTHTIAFGGLPTPMFYRIDPFVLTVTQSGTYFESLTSNDWNASIAANEVGDCFVTWTSTDLGVIESDLPQVMLSGKLSPATGISPLSNISGFTSPTAYTGFGSAFERWGDYSAVTIDPSNTASAWLVNEKVNSAGHDATGSGIWGSRIIKFGN